jgi:hypothetical protein
LIWDLKDDRKQLFDLEAAGETQDLSQSARARSTALTTQLTEHVRKRGERFRALHGEDEPASIAVEDLSENERQLLIRLGYIEPDEEVEAPAVEASP